MMMIISANEVMFSSALANLFVSRLMQNCSPDFHKIRRRKKRVDFRGNPDHVTLGLWLGLRLSAQYCRFRDTAFVYGGGGDESYSATLGLFYPAFV